MSGRKRHIIVDTMGLLLEVVVHPADIQDRDGAKLVISKMAERSVFSVCVGIGLILAVGRPVQQNRAASEHS